MSNEINDFKFQPYYLEDVHSESDKALFTVVSTFAGGGGSSTGYRLAGGNVLLVNEFIPEAVETYKENYPDTPVLPINIREITSGKSKDIKECFKSYGIEPRELDILDGSPPCCDYSKSNTVPKHKRKKVSTYSGTTQKSVGKLIHDFVTVATAMCPKVIIIENVPTIQKAAVFKKALNRLRKKGYLINFSTLTASHFDVSQRRKRLFVVGVRHDIAEKAGITNESDILEIYPTGSTYEPTIRDCLSNLEIDKRERNLLLTSCRQSSHYELIRSMPFSPQKPLTIRFVDPEWTSDFNLVRSSWDKPCPTLTQLGQKTGRSGVFHPDENRKFAINELKRLTGLPDDFHLTGTFNQQAERICRMVPPLMTKALATAVYEAVLSKL